LKFVVIGNGIAGNSVIEKVREIDRDVELTVISEESCPEYSACILASYLSGEIKRERVFLKTEEDYRKEGINTIFGKKVTEIDTVKKRVVLEEGYLSYDKLVVATGSKGITPPIGGVNKEGVFLFKSIEDADKILHFNPTKAVVVGSGPIGIEVCIALKKRNCEVYLVELLDWILPKVFDKRSASFLERALELNGVRVITGEKVIKIVGDRRVEGVITDKREIECDTVVLAAGMRPNVELARKAGIEIGKLGGIKVNEFMMTDKEDVYACGDCVETKNIVTGKECLNLLWFNAKQQGDTVGYNLLGIKRAYPGSQNIVIINVFNIFGVSIGETLATLGNDNSIEVIEKDYGNSYYRLLTFKDRVVGVQAINKIEFMGLMLGLIRRREGIKSLWAKMRFYNSILGGSLFHKIKPYIY